MPASPLQPVYNIAALCAAHGLTEVVLSPGSRCAPLTLAFARHPETNVRVVPDERAAAFIGLGIAQARRVPTVLVCTSGTAGLNYAPAVAEAYYQQVALLILTADRPPEWIDQLDGQTIRQTGLYGPHVKASYTFPTEFSHPDAKWHSERIINEAINLAKAYPPGPVHVNIPLREPLYPKAGEEVAFGEVRVVRETMSPPRISPREITELAQTFSLAGRILFAFGQNDTSLRERLPAGGVEGFQLEEVTGAAFLSDVIGNMQPEDESRQVVISAQDVFLASESVAKQLRPDILITTGKSFISKAFKNFLRRNPPTQHWHIQPAGAVADTFGALTHVIRAEPSEFIDSILESATHEGQLPTELRQERLQYQLQWKQVDEKASHLLFDGRQGIIGSSKQWTEYLAMSRVLVSIARGTALHLANSMAVRYANILGVPTGVEVFANRGTSGIDGCSSTAVGYALARPDQQVVLLTGDVAFFYDRNAFWHNYPTPNLRVVLLNNHGGGIFRLIDGPRQQPEIDEFFETRQQLTAENLARDFHLPYFPVTSMAELEATLPVFFGPEGAGGILEVLTDSKTNAEFFEQYRAAVKAAFS